MKTILADDQSLKYQDLTCTDHHCYGDSFSEYNVMSTIVFGPVSPARFHQNICPHLVLIHSKDDDGMPSDGVFGVRRGLCVRAALAALNRKPTAKSGAYTHTAPHSKNRIAG